MQNMVRMIDDIIYTSAKGYSPRNRLLMEVIILVLENESNNIKWFKENDLRIKIKNIGEESIITVLLGKYNICFKLIMFEFINSLKEDKIIDISIVKNSYNQRVFVVDSKNDIQVAKYIIGFAREWDIKISKDTVSESDVIYDEIWYKYD